MGDTSEWNDAGTSFEPAQARDLEPTPPEPAGHVHGEGAGRVVTLDLDLMARNDAVAARNRALFAERDMLVLNLMSGPGAGKTTLLLRTLERLRGRMPLAVIEGDQATANDAERIRAAGVPAVQVNTDQGCHLDAAMVERALADLPRQRGGILFIENVGNLVCPAGFDLGEHHKVLLAAVTEGEDKPLKYPGMFAASDVLLISKCDLLPVLEFDAALLEANARRVHPDMDILRICATRADGLTPWLAWLEARRGAPVWVAGRI